MYAADMRICGETWSSYTLKSVLVLAKDILLSNQHKTWFRRTQGCGWEFELIWICAYGRRLLLLWGSDYIFCVLFVVITIVKFGVKVFIRGNPFYWVLITKKSVKTYEVVNCLAFYCFEMISLDIYIVRISIIK